MSSMNLYVGNLPFQTTENDLAELFSPYGTVVGAKIITDRETGRSRGFGFVEMAERSEGEQAITSLNDQEVEGRRIKVNEAKPRSDNRRSGGYKGGGGRY